MTKIDECDMKKLGTHTLQLVDSSANDRYLRRQVVATGGETERE